MSPPSDDQKTAFAQRRQRLLAIALTMGAVFCFTGIDVCAKYLSPRYGPVETTWLRYASAMLIVAAFLNPLRVPGLFATKVPGLQILRGVCLLASTALNFIALQYLQLAQTVSIMFLAPLLVALLAGPVLGEWAGPRRLIAIGIGFCGVLIVTRPGLGIVHPAALYSLLGTTCYAAILLITRIIARHDSSETTMFYSTLFGALLMAPLAWFVWITPQSLVDWAIILLCGTFGVLGHWLLIHAQKRAPAPVLAPFLYTQLVWMIGSGILVFGELPDRWTLVGGTVVVLSGLYLLHREHVRQVPNPRLD